MRIPTVMDPQVVTMVGWPMGKDMRKALKIKPGNGIAMAIMATHSNNLQPATLVNFASFILRELGTQVGLERASEIVFQMAQTMDIKRPITPPQYPDDAYDPLSEFDDYKPFDRTDYDGYDRDGDDEAYDDPDEPHSY